MTTEYKKVLIKYEFTSDIFDNEKYVRIFAFVDQINILDKCFNNNLNSSNNLE